MPVPDTAKAAADAMAYALGLPSVEGLMRNRYVGRTFIEGTADREAKARLKYTPLPEVLAGKRVLLVEDSIVRSTTMRALVHEIRDRGGAREIHLRVACPPIIAPCFYGIDMSTRDELFAPRFADLPDGGLSEAAQDRLAEELGADSLRYLPVEAIARSVGLAERPALPGLRHRPLPHRRPARPWLDASTPRAWPATPTAPAASAPTNDPTPGRPARIREPIRRTRFAIRRPGPPNPTSAALPRIDPDPDPGTRPRAATAAPSSPKDQPTMPPPPILTPDEIDLDHVVAGREEIHRHNPQRFEMEQLTAIVRLDTERHLIVGYKDVAADEFWVRGHIPGFPLMPGVLLCEAAAQLCSYYCREVRLVPRAASSASAAWRTSASGARSGPASGW